MGLLLELTCVEFPEFWEVPETLDSEKELRCSEQVLESNLELELKLEFVESFQLLVEEMRVLLVT